MSNLADGYEKFRRGEFSESHHIARAVVPRGFWPDYLAAVSSAFQANLKEFEKDLAALEAWGEDNVYLEYLKAYYALLQQDVEKALWHYLALADKPEGWLAKSIVKKFRKAKKLDGIEMRAADFVALPAELPPVTRIDRPNRHNRFILPSIAILASFILVFYFWPKAKKTNIEIPELQVADSAAVMPAVGPPAAGAKKSEILYRYKTREGIIRDFENAKTLLRAKKVNQCRFVLNRLIFSNADFQTREKSKIFLGFIPELGYTEFNDNITLTEVFEDTPLRKDSLLLVAGELRDAAQESAGTLYQFIVREGSDEYRVHAYLAQSQREEKSNLAAKQVQVYGKFKGLVGDQKTVYLEALRVWR